MQKSERLYAITFQLAGAQWRLERGNALDARDIFNKLIDLGMKGAAITEIETVKTTKSEVYLGQPNMAMIKGAA